MTLDELFDWHCREGDRWHRLSEEEKSCGPKRLKESVRRTYAKKADLHRAAADCLKEVISRS